MENKTRRIVKTYMDSNGIVIFLLLQGQKRLRTVHTFGYGTCHDIWLRVHGLGTGTVSMSVEPASVVKEQIAQWHR